MLWRCDLTPQYEQYRAEINNVIQGVLSSGRYVLAENVLAFENEFARYIENQNPIHAVGVNSGTDALIMALWALGVKSGDEVITTPFTAIPTYSAIKHVGATPIFVDIEPDTWLIDSKKIAEALSEKTKAVIPVHLFGNPVDIDEVRRVIGPHIPILEDCAQSHGAMVRGSQTGTMGDIGAFSFYPTKNLGAYGDGGLVTTKNFALAEFIRKRRMYGMVNKDEFDEDGMNTRLDEIQAAILRVKLPHLDEMNQKRQRLFDLYRELLPLDNLALQVVRPDCVSVHHVMSVTCLGDNLVERDRLGEFLTSQDIQSNVYYPMPLYKQKAYSKNFKRKYNLPVVEKISRQILALPFYPEMTESSVNQVANAIKKFYEGRSR